MALGLFIRGAAAIAEELTAISRVAHAAAADAAEAVAKEVKDRVETSPKVSRRTGQLDESWHIRRDEERGSATLYNTAPYSKALEYGLKGVVMAKNRSGSFSPRKVNVPEKAFLRGAIEETRERIDEIAGNAFRRRIDAE